MRLGQNPKKQQNDLPDFHRHRVIVPVYVPSLEGYFESMPEILALCLESLRRTSDGRASVTVVSNACAPQIVEQLQRAYDEGWIDQLLLNQTNRGKIDAVIPVARGCFEEMITISDCDVLFMPGWIDAVETIFGDFPECGFVATMPAPSGAGRHTSATLLGGMFRRELCFEKVVPEEDLERFAHSINRPDLCRPQWTQSQMVVKRNGTVACVGGGHFAFTMRREMIDGMPKGPSQKAINGNSEENWLDIPPDRLGYWRLATTRAYTHHMGNVPEPWMSEEMDKIRRSEARDGNSTGNTLTLAPLRKNWMSRIPWRSRQLLVRALKRTGRVPKPR